MEKTTISMGSSSGQLWKRTELSLNSFTPGLMVILPVRM